MGTQQYRHFFLWATLITGSASGASTAASVPEFNPDAKVPCYLCPLEATSAFADCAAASGFSTNNTCANALGYVEYRCRTSCTESLLPSAACEKLLTFIPELQRLPEKICVDSSGKPDLVAGVIKCNPLQVNVTNKGEQAAPASTTRVAVLATVPITKNIATPSIPASGSPSNTVTLEAGMLPAFCAGGCQVTSIADVANVVDESVEDDNISTQTCFK
jgi:hypothetical protein